ncbi:hypothetical protein H6G54_02850 [Anabaena cylindrica FACHB-243]|uniref:Ig-like domain-containing protein n=1 Tax=Anabaena cylindrica (strain ATCC 27899 / PCC 7122) TaxID=272123 RepID=K9ZDN9_ANACC|nr:MULTISPECIES: hypothetical protein [Anabaena]AFZ56859.1 hypothetical protein Anacy_1338 [Anabaena cylindrica PCC 7122]MBD2416665.1 hypothetical protein [Anabaena cylindrica FACHB-243]MBY5285660.1 hypothetical protein [Anabaena sp. CCAP 1446/1C]MBY5311682.1 hypothetical protein [Anabaena sp. CCAP 1446/1C]MCM2409036.1 hypothetical protein [Anabaena sp. CCAP 1446/1C]
MPKLKSVKLTNLLFLLCFLNNWFLATPSQAQVIQPNQLDCENVESSAMVMTTEGVKTVSMFCDFQEKREQKFTDVKSQQQQTQSIPRPSLGKPYELNGNVCRNQGADMICLTPQGASNLRWNK